MAAQQGAASVEAMGELSMQGAGRKRVLDNRGGRSRRYGLTAALAAGVFVSGLVLQALPASADTWTGESPPGCPTATYTVPANTYYIQVNAVGGAGRGGYTETANNTGGPGGAGAHVYTWIPVTPGEQLDVVVAHNGDAQDVNAGFPDGGTTAYGSGKGGGASFVTRPAGNPCIPDISKADPQQILVVAGGGGGGGGADTFGSGGAGGNAGNKDGSGQGGSTAYQDGLGDEGSGGGGATTTTAGSGGAHGCGLPGLCGDPGGAGSFLRGGTGFDLAPDDHISPNGAGGAGGGGYFGGGGGGAGDDGGGGGGGAGSSYVTPTALFQQFTTDTTGVPSVDIYPIATPTTTATLTGTTSGNDWYTSAVTVNLTAQAGDHTVVGTYFSLDNAACGPTDLAACQVSTGKSLSVSTSGLHTLRFFSLDSDNLAEGVQTKTFAVTPASVAVTGASINSGSAPAVTSTGSGGTVSVTGSGSGTVGAAVYGSNPAGAPVFNSSGAYVDVLASGSDLTGVTVYDCNLNGGTTVSWWTGTTWKLASDQVYDASKGCVAVRVTSSTSPSLQQLTGTVLAAGRPPTASAVATTADGKPYTAGTWTNQSVTVTAACSPGATAGAPTTLTRDGANQSAVDNCTDGLGQTATTTFTGIDVDKTAPSCSTTVNPTVLWVPNGKPVAITGTTSAADALSGVARVVGGAVTSNEALAAGDVQGFAVNSRYVTPLQLSALVPDAGQLKATRNGNGAGRTYTQAFTVMDQAGNTNTTPCAWTVTVPHDQATGH